MKKINKATIKRIVEGVLKENQGSVKTIYQGETVEVRIVLSDVLGNAVQITNDDGQTLDLESAEEVLQVAQALRAAAKQLR